MGRISFCYHEVLLALRPLPRTLFDGRNAHGGIYLRSRELADLVYPFVFARLDQREKAKTLEPLVCLGRIHPIRH